MNEPLVSVIIPIYKVEQYLEQCLDSVVNQTYRNLEIILIDDGSPDNCGAICDAYKVRDERIIVIHQENQGLSAARNAGLDICKGEYISFVDSDDWVEPDYIKYLLEYANENTIVACGRAIYNGESIDYKVIEKNATLTGMEAVDAYLNISPINQYIEGYVWLKLYPKKVFAELRFPKGKTYEDLFIFVDIFAEIENLIIINKCLYNYRIRDGSIMNSLSRESFDDIWAGIEYHEKLLQNKFALTNKLNLRKLCCVYSELIAHYRNKFTVDKAELEELRKKLAYCSSKTENISSRFWLKIKLLLYCPYLFISIWSIKNETLPYVKCLYKKISCFR